MIDVKFSLESPTGNVFSDTVSFWIDSGFDGCLKLPESYASGFTTLGIKCVDTYTTVASGVVPSFSFLGQIDEIYVGGTKIDLTSSIDCDISSVGPSDSPPLIGLSALSKWNICLDIKNDKLSFL